MPLKSRNNHPPGGFQFPEPTLRIPENRPFNVVRDAAIAYRRANPKDGKSINPVEVGNEIDYFNCVRLGFDPAWCYPEPTAAEKKTPSISNVQHPQVSHPPQPQPMARPSIEKLEDRNPSLPPPPLKNHADTDAGESVEISAWERVRRVAHGVVSLAEWIGSGAEPVPMEQAEVRSKVCEPCPLNDTKGEHKITKAAAKKLAELVEIKRELKLHVSNEANIGTCLGCSCNLGLKVFVPLKNIDTSKKALKKLDPNCWIIAEHNAG